MHTKKLATQPIQSVYELGIQFGPFVLYEYCIREYLNNPSSILNYKIILASNLREHLFSTKREIMNQ